MTDDAERIAAGLSEAQRRAVLTASFHKQDGVWHPEGWHSYADKRVRWNLCRQGLTHDYLRRYNRLTPLGLAVREHLKKADQ